MESFKLTYIMIVMIFSQGFKTSIAPPELSIVTSDYAHEQLSCTLAKTNFISGGI